MKFFEIPMRNFSQLVRIRQKLDENVRLVSFLDEFQRQENIWMKILWKDVDIQQLINDVDAFLERFRQFPMQSQTNRRGQEIDQILQDFRSNLSILIELKNESIRERHWKQLIDENMFDHRLMTLENLFQLHFHRDEDKIRSKDDSDSFV